MAEGEARQGRGMPAITLSAGCAFADRLQPGEDLLKNADRALYRVKQSGRNGCAFHTSFRRE